jgi:hypothetical protein
MKRCFCACRRRMRVRSRNRSGCLIGGLSFWSRGGGFTSCAGPGELGVIQGLLSLEDRRDHIYVHLVENAKRNRGRSKMFTGVAGNLFAFACKMAFEKGYKGDVALLPKRGWLIIMRLPWEQKGYWKPNVLGGDFAAILVITYFSIHDEGQDETSLENPMASIFLWNRNPTPQKRQRQLVHFLPPEGRKTLQIRSAAKNGPPRKKPPEETSFGSRMASISL